MNTWNSHNVNNDINMYFSNLRIKETANQTESLKQAALNNFLHISSHFHIKLFFFFFFDCKILHHPDHHRLPPCSIPHFLASSAGVCSYPLLFLLLKFSCFSSSERATGQKTMCCSNKLPRRAFQIAPNIWKSFNATEIYI